MVFLSVDHYDVFYLSEKINSLNKIEVYRSDLQYFVITKRFVLVYYAGVHINMISLNVFSFLCNNNG